MIKDFKRWLRHRSNTIRYKCPHCKTKLEVINEASSDIETCPECKKVHLVPMSKSERKNIRRTKIAKWFEVRRANVEANRKIEQARVEANRKRILDEREARYCLRITCPHCQGIFRAKKLSSGHRWACPECGGSVGGESNSNGGDAFVGAILGSMLF